MVTVLNEIALASRRTVVELGSGISTIVIGRLMAERGGKVVAVEHDPEWAGWVRSQIDLERLSASTEVIVSPLEPHPASWDGAPWYSRRSVALLPESVDLLLVDGPPGYGDGRAHSRYPAMAALASRLSAQAIVILDDADREAEREIVARWSEECESWTFGIDEGLGLAVGRRD